jgi:hypothetical protein
VKKSRSTRLFLSVLLFKSLAISSKQKHKYINRRKERNESPPHEILSFLLAPQQEQQSQHLRNYSKQASKAIFAVGVFFWGGGGIETDLKRGPSSCPLGSLMDRNAEFSKTKKWWF